MAELPVSQMILALRTVLADSRVGYLHLATRDLVALAVRAFDDAGADSDG